MYVGGHEHYIPKGCVKCSDSWSFCHRDINLLKYLLMRRAKAIKFAQVAAFDISRVAYYSVGK
jgi:hypothetical protein